MFLIVTLAAVPLIFESEFCIPGTVVLTSGDRTISLVLSMIGYAICFTLIFLFWCMAALLYDDSVYGKNERPYSNALRGVSRLGVSALWSGLIFGILNVFILQFSQMIVSILLGYLASGQGNGANQQVLFYILVYLSYIIADLILVLIILIPQMLVFEGGRKVDEVIRASYLVVKERYRNAVMLLIIPELVIRTLFIASLYAINLVPSSYAIFIFLLTLAVLEGGRLAFAAAAFNRFYYHVVEEEKKKRKKGKSKKQGGGKPAAGKQLTGKQAPKKQSAGKQQPRKKPAGKQGKKK